MRACPACQQSGNILVLKIYESGQNSDNAIVAHSERIKRRRKKKKWGEAEASKEIVGLTNENGQSHLSLF